MPPMNEMIGGIRSLQSGQTKTATPALSLVCPSTLSLHCPGQTGDNVLALPRGRLGTMYLVCPGQCGTVGTMHSGLRMGVKWIYF